MSVTVSVIVKKIKILHGQSAEVICIMPGQDVIFTMNPGHDLKTMIQAVSKNEGRVDLFFNDEGGISLVMLTPGPPPDSEEYPDDSEEDQERQGVIANADQSP